MSKFLVICFPSTSVFEHFAGQQPVELLAVDVLVARLLLLRNRHCRRPVAREGGLLVEVIRRRVIAVVVVGPAETAFRVRRWPPLGRGRNGRQRLQNSLENYLKFAFFDFSQCVKCLELRILNIKCHFKKILRSGKPQKLK